MAIRKPTMPAEKSAAFAEFLKQQASVQDSQFKPGSIIEGTVSAVKGDDVFVDIGYKSEGVVSLDEFADKEAVKPGLKFQVMLRDLENDKTGMVVLSKKAADDQIRWEKVLAQYTEGCVVNGTIRSQVRGGLLVDIDGVEAFLPGSQVDVMSVRDLAPYIGQTFDFKVIKISNERKNIIISRRELIEGTMAEKKAALLASLQKGEIRKGRVKNITDFGAFIEKRNFSAEFKRESAQLVVDQNYTVADAAKAMDVGLSTMTRWVKQLRDERQGKTPKASPITPEQIEIRELRKKLQRIEMENEILKKATVDSIGQRNSYVKTWGCGGFLNETNIYSRGKSLCF